MYEDDPEFEWWAFLNGKDGFISKTVCRMSDDLRKHIGSRSQLVYMGLAYAQKSAHKHGLSPNHFLMLEAAIKYGAAYEDPSGLAFFLREPNILKSNYYVVIKTTGYRDEMWIKTFHRKRDKDLKKAIRWKPLLREHT